ncbi:MAG: type II toxin-antitoxin system PemK/MazF family toxin [Bacteroidales bacterium]|jgi:mRNA interferase MazF|nr:type II toxin-antitoxin system PemK/MazF family toxin [Bacteroidales bacterium]
MEINQFGIYWVNLNPTLGSEIAKTRPCVVASPDVLNKHLNTVVVIPLTSTIKPYSFRIPCIINGKSGAIATDQIRTVDKARIKAQLGSLPVEEINKLKMALYMMFCE